MDHEEKIASFCSITGAKPEQAAFFLEGCNWDLDSAMSSFLDEDVDDQSGPSNFDSVPADKGEEADKKRDNSAGPTETVRGGGGQGSAPAGGRRKEAAAASSRIKTFAELSRASSDGNDDDDDDEPNEYYTGGEKSGMMVQDPRRGNRSANVDAIFENARQLGAREGNTEDLSASDTKKQKGTFTGRGRTLTSSTEDNAESEETGEKEAPDPQRPVLHVIVFWRNGFTVDNGPLRTLTDPANAPFLMSINRGECPRELAPAVPSTPVEVNLVKKDEDYVPPPEPRYMAFTGVGRTLGGTSASAGPSSSPSPSHTLLTASPSPSLGNVTPHKGLVVDESRPVTSLQLRLSDGTRMVARFNLDHTVGDIRAFIDAARPGPAASYQLQSMGFPPKPLLDPSQTIEAAGLVNSVIVQR